MSKKHRNFRSSRNNSLIMKSTEIHANENQANKEQSESLTKIGEIPREQKYLAQTTKITYYSDEFKRAVVKEVLDGHITKSEARQKYGIKGKTCVLDWIRSYEYMQANNQKWVEDPTPKVPSLEELQAENSRLRIELHLVQLQVQEINLMMDIAKCNSVFPNLRNNIPNSMKTPNDHAPEYLRNRFAKFANGITKKIKSILN